MKNGKKPDERDPRVSRPTEPVPVVVVEGKLGIVRHTDGAVDFFRPGRPGEDYWVLILALTSHQMVLLEATASPYAPLGDVFYKAALRAARHLHTGRHR